MVERSDLTSLPHVLIEVVEAVDSEEVEVGVISVVVEVVVAADSEGAEGVETSEGVVEVEVVVEVVEEGSTVKQSRRILALSRPSRERKRRSMIEV